MDATRAAGVTCVVWALCCLRLPSLGSCCARRCVQRALPQVVAAPVVGKLARVAVDLHFKHTLDCTHICGALCVKPCSPREGGGLTCARCFAGACLQTTSNS